jgi:hypothetical protein
MSGPDFRIPSRRDAAPPRPAVKRFPLRLRPIGSVPTALLPCDLDEDGFVERYEGRFEAFG